jgi:putative SOS response-associated peptidase YedK
MCGRYALHSNPGVVALQFGLAHPPALDARYNIAPGTPILAIRADTSHVRSGSLMHWGLIPSWAKDPTIGHRLINARAETLAEKPSFRSAFRRRRCIIPANGFYEWMATSGRKQPYYIRPSKDELFGFAGLYEHWKGPDGPVESCTIITTDANELMRPIHDRMPVILPVEAYAHWLDPENPDPGALTAMLRPAPAERMAAFPVSYRVNSVKNDGAELIQPQTRDQLI